ncbi:hypothetical protein KY340_03890 [Candidatus Woesearchaeota archaeon]|nr:hypothetical protein [Candidatus Woesearchaeota archaeon]
MELTYYNPNGPSDELVKKISDELGDVERDLADLVRRPLGQDRVNELIDEIFANLRRSHVTAQWEDGYNPELLRERKAGMGRFKIERGITEDEFYETDSRYFLVAIKPYLNGKNADLGLGMKVKKLLEFKYNLLENHQFGQSLFGREKHEGEAEDVEKRIEKAIECVDQLIGHYIASAPTEKKSVADKLYLNSENIARIDKWAKERIYDRKRENLVLVA